MRTVPIRVLSVLFFYALPTSLKSQDEGSAWILSLDSITVKGYRYKSPIKTDYDGTVSLDLNHINLMPQILGNADPMHYARMLPGVQTSNEYQSGINIDGCDNGHNITSINGVPIYNANHLFGFFSTFNTSHFSALSLTKAPLSGASPNRIGGQLDLQTPREMADTLSGQFLVGMISSQGTISLPIHARTTVTLSLRASFMDLLYSQWMRIDDQQVKYRFYDTNLTLMHKVNCKNTVVVDFYSGKDTGGFFESDYLADMKAKWGNTMGAVHWLHEDKPIKAVTTVYATSYRNALSIDMQDLSFQLPSGITEIGGSTQWSWKRLKAGAEASWFTIKPQSVEKRGSFGPDNVNTSSQHPISSSLYANYTQPLPGPSDVSVGIRGSIFHNGGLTSVAADPSFRFTYNGSIQFSASYALRHQYLFLTGFTDVGLPTEFWMPATSQQKPQYAHIIAVGAGKSLFGGKYRMNVECFYRKLHHQQSYRGSVLDFVNSTYDINNNLFHGQGYNYGFSVMINKRVGKLVGMANYTYTHAIRNFEQHPDDYPASHERPHEFNALASYTIGKHWILGGTAVYASGTPFTPAESLYILNNNIVMKYGRFNSSRLHSYFRLDLSANYQWHDKKGLKHGLNFSLYNATSHENELFYHISFKEGRFAYRPVSFIFRVLPSISYHCQF